jgi:hypothetical protein
VIVDVGDAPYDLAQPILKKVSAKQLAEIESNCPQIKLRSEEIWKLFIMRDFSDRPVPTTKFRKTYAKYYREKEAHLKDASVRLKEGLEKFKQEKASRTITTIRSEDDPLAARARAKRKASSAAPPGSRLIQKALQAARAKGPIFSSKSIKFSSNYNHNAEPTIIYPPRKSIIEKSPMKRPLENTAEELVDKKLKTDSSYGSPEKANALLSRTKKKPANIFMPVKR